MKKKKGLKIFGIIVLILVILLVAIIGGTYWFIQDKLSKIQKVDLKEEDLKVSSRSRSRPN